MTSLNEPIHPNTAQGAEMPPSVAEVSAGQTAFERAYRELESAIRAVPQSKLRHINIDLRGSVAATVARMPRLRELRPQLAKELPTFPIGYLDQLDQYAHAAAHAYLRHQAASVTPPELAQLVDTAIEMRTMMIADVQALAARRLIDRAPLDELSRLSGYKNLGYDLLLLNRVVRGVLSEVKEKTALTEEELERVVDTAERLLIAAGERSVDPNEPTDTALVRDQAFALFMDTYDQVRRAVSYLRWSDRDVDDYIPSLYARRGQYRGAVAASPLPSEPSDSPAEED